ncbi:hypothetical protein AA3266_1387 [Gluconobacter kondonii NBRC 3266]|nr:hypothetical protein AA3266_1387 [Gluconobacter kondonii NBRC 3266]
MMRHKKIQTSCCNAGRLQRLEPCLARPFLQPPFRKRRERQEAGGYVHGGKPFNRQPCFGSRFRPQGMIHYEGHNIAAPATSQKRERHGVGAPRNGKGDWRVRDIRWPRTET